tara:strand:- start:406 stop:1809 length:1404 start_codon:yes stop_codon:yes gene_type:complete
MRYILPLIHFCLISVLLISCEKDCADVRGGDNICGCDDETALNYDYEVTHNDGSCEYDTTPPMDITLNPVGYFLNSFHLYWSKNTDSDFRAYHIYRNDLLVDSITTSSKNEYTITGMTGKMEDNFHILVLDKSNNSKKSNTQIGSSYDLIVSTSGGDIYSLNTNSIFPDKNEKKLDLFYSGKKLTINSLLSFYDGSRIIFGGHVDGNYDIWSVYPNGANLERLTFEPEEDRFPIFSPDGLKIAYISASLPNSVENNIFMMNNDGTNKRSLTSNELINSRHIRFSSDGNSIIFSGKKSDRYEIYTINSDGTNLNKLTSQPERKYNDSHPAFVLNGTKIIYQSYSGCGNHIRIMNADGSDNKMLLDCYFSNPIVSPDGNQLIIIENNWRFFSYDLVNNQSKMITNPLNSTEYADFHPQYFDNGNKIVFVAKAQPNKRDIWVINSDGTGRYKVNASSRGYEHTSVQPHIK